eukprot:TRINITY_DN1016_c1_g1_i1.p1 TRINITY_DN1016_c1_g1~~TRINITY_DN1016_c1_g1_i1.p1  ORF type:complete len:337 (+),score=97.15 TRINITY_DN1016_c1_g1_i1:20-1030(+)
MERAFYFSNGKIEEKMGEEDRVFVDVVFKLAKKNVEYLNLLNPSLDPSKFCYSINQLNEKELEEIVEILNIGSGKRKSKRRAIFHYLYPGDYPKENTEVNVDEKFVKGVQTILASHLPVQFISYFNRKINPLLLQNRLQQEGALNIKFFFEAIKGNGSNKKITVENLMAYLRPQTMKTERGREDQLIKNGKEHFLADSTTNFEVVSPKERKRKREGEAVLGHQVMKPTDMIRKEVVNDVWEAFKRKKVDQIEQDIINKSALQEQTKRELEEKKKQMEQLTESLEENRQLLSYSHTILEKLKKKYAKYQKHTFVTPFDFESEYLQIQQEESSTINKT